MFAIMEAHGLSYIATASIAYPQDLYAKFVRAKEMRDQGVRYIHVLAPCPPGWGYDTAKTIEIGKLAVKSGFWPLFEIINGKFEISKPSKPLLDPENRKPITEYISPQRRYRKIKEDGIGELNKYIDSVWKIIHDRLFIQNER